LASAFFGVLIFLTAGFLAALVFLAAGYLDAVFFLGVFAFFGLAAFGLVPPSLKDPEAPVLNCLS
jgi:hypothetical protein